MRSGISILISLSLFTAVSAQAQITTFSSRPAFDAAVGPATLENFTSDIHFPISSGVLNSRTHEAGILPGDIQPGVTYSTAIGTGNFFNIDAGANFSGGFLDTITGNGALTITFDTPVRAFGFDTNRLAGASTTVTLIGGTPFTHTFPLLPTLNMQFIGLESGAQDITGATILSPGRVSFAIDNFSFTSVLPAAPPSAAVPEPSSVALVLSIGFSAAGLLARRCKTTGGRRARARRNT